MSTIPPALAAAHEADAIPPVVPLTPEDAGRERDLLAHLKSWVRAEIELRLAGVGLRHRQEHNP